LWVKRVCVLWVKGDRPGIRASLPE
jgi:hypothetical protein